MALYISGKHPKLKIVYDTTDEQFLPNGTVSGGGCKYIEFKENRYLTSDPKLMEIIEGTDDFKSGRITKATTTADAKDQLETAQMKGKNLVCPLCNKVYKSRAGVLEHMKKHLGTDAELENELQADAGSRTTAGTAQRAGQSQDSVGA
jgi:hypothetical protein